MNDKAFELLKRVQANKQHEVAIAVIVELFVTALMLAMAYTLFGLLFNLF